MGDSNNPAPPTGYRWREIEDLPADLAARLDPELEALREMWRIEREGLEPSAVERVSAELAREWAIETGIIEGVYTLDRGITLTLIEHGIKAALIPHDATNKDPELVARIIQAHANVLEGLFAFVKGERTLSTSYIKELHAGLMRYQPTVTVFDQFGQHSERELKSGEYKSMPNSPLTPDGSIHEYCPPEHVAAEMDRLVALHSEHIQRGLPPQVSAAWLHHAFTQIHPFQDGNGRVARAIASLVFIKSGDFPLVVTRDQRTSYIDALEAADGGNLAALVGLFSSLQKRALTVAVMKSADTRHGTTVDEALNLTRDLLVATSRIIPPEYLKAKQASGRVWKVAAETFGRVSNRLINEISQANPQYRFQVNSSGAPPTDKLAILSDHFDYEANPTDYHQTMQLLFSLGIVESAVVLSLHSAGRRFSGLVVGVAYFLQTGQERPVPLCDDIFRISYQEDEDSVVSRFNGWLDACLIRGLAEWRRTLV